MRLIPSIIQYVIVSPRSSNESELLHQKLKYNESLGLRCDRLGDDGKTAKREKKGSDGRKMKCF